ncbi:nitric oxide reductase transcriptional regulator NorR [Halomonas daqingensis]|uniref:Nitric oxide reductase transcriptional regulator NorR n=1 Tax=Billgrantia desiderata TaxID=52021 RepID=A0ABS9B989_9GAMM|nr:nitric oxide reductase transcriptional regulator NorR [Halomonas desiderata]MCE8043725.1 nitric oxide reductase transcriptional regulator NorR [Halomonas desiderata]MCE8048299.1 nitric oxide reductase transcriptional regulator NorR [Halomonas desiderata]
MLDDSLLADLTADLPSAVRLQRLVRTLREGFRCGAVCLLQLQQDVLAPVAVEGLVREALGRRFEVARHPRLAAILTSRRSTLFPPDSSLPDPYDGLVEQQPGEPLHVHDCMGISLHVEGEPWGVLTLDALVAGTFDETACTALERYALLVEAAVRVSRLEQEVRALRMAGHGSIAHVESGEGGEILGHSAELQRLLHELDVVAESDLPVLLMGETGVGKELFARRLHQRSPRRDQPLVQVNCAALPETLAESELFGHVKGAFSGATADRAGRFEAADGGTLFLDEVGELPLAIQAKLLRALHNGEVQRLGEDTPRRVDVRIIAATNRQLADGVRDGLFRADLYHRLSVYPVAIPPLRERGSDVLVLAGHFLEINRARLGVRSLRLAPTAETALLGYRWPGNVRELEHVISRAAIKALGHGARRDDIVTLQPEWLDLSHGETLKGEPLKADSRAPDTQALATHDIEPLRRQVEDTQRWAIRQALAACDGHWANASRRLAVDPSNLHKLARRLGIK